MEYFLGDEPEKQRCCELETMGRNEKAWVKKMAERMVLEELVRGWR